MNRSRACNVASPSQEAGLDQKICQAESPDLLIQSLRKSIHLPGTARNPEHSLQAWSREATRAHPALRLRRSGHSRSANEYLNQRSVRRLANEQSRSGRHRDLPATPDRSIRTSIQLRPRAGPRHLSSRIHPIPAQPYWKMLVPESYPDRNSRPLAKPIELPASVESCTQEGDAPGSKLAEHPAALPSIAAVDSACRRRAVQS